MAVTSGEPTKEKLFQALRTQGEMTVSEMATAAQITPVAVRHHLASMQAEGLVKVREERHGVGRPRQIFKLTPNALERSTSRYYQFTNLLLEQLKKHLPPELFRKILFEVAMSMASAWKDELETLPLPHRLDRLVELLTREGFLERVESRGTGQYVLTQLACPYSRISLSHPEVCTLDSSMISLALGTPVEQVSCIRNGSNFCTYSITVSEKETHHE